MKLIFICSTRTRKKLYNQLEQGWASKGISELLPLKFLLNLKPTNSTNALAYTDT